MLTFCTTTKAVRLQEAVDVVLRLSMYVKGDRVLEPVFANVTLYTRLGRGYQSEKGKTELKSIGKLKERNLL